MNNCIYNILWLDEDKKKKVSNQKEVCSFYRTADNKEGDASF